MQKKEGQSPPWPVRGGSATPWKEKKMFDGFWPLEVASKKNLEGWPTLMGHGGGLVTPRSAGMEVAEPPLWPFRVVRPPPMVKTHHFFFFYHGVAWGGQLLFSF
jgi:hypothetical protein